MIKKSFSKLLKTNQKKHFTRCFLISFYAYNVNMLNNFKQFKLKKLTVKPTGSTCKAWAFNFSPLNETRPRNSTAPIQSQWLFKSLALSHCDRQHAHDQPSK